MLGVFRNYRFWNMLYFVVLSLFHFEKIEKGFFISDDDQRQVYHEQTT